MMDGAMRFHDPLRVKSGFLELTIHVAGKHETTLFKPGCQFLQDGKPGMRFGLPVELEPMPIKPPGPAGLCLKALGAAILWKSSPAWAKAG